MEAGASSGPEVLQLRAVLRGISPLIWRRLLVRGDTSGARLHEILQVAFGWQNMHLHRFEIRGREYEVPQEGGIFFGTDAHEALIGQLKLRRLERFTYEYDFGDSWVHDVRIEASLPFDPKKRVYPVCIAGQRAAPPEDCGGPQAFMATRFEYTLISESRFLHESDDLLDEVEDEEWEILRHYHPDSLRSARSYPQAYRVGSSMATFILKRRLRSSEHRLRWPDMRRRPRQVRRLY